MDMQKMVWCAFGVGLLVIQGACGAPEVEQASVTTEQASATTEQSDQAEAVGEAVQDWTKADCYAMWKHNLQICNSAPPNLRPECWAACAVWLGACLAAAQG